MGGANWERIGARIKTAILDGALPEVDFEPRPPVTVDVIRPDGEEHPEGLVVVVRAPHRVGLLWATCSWFATHGCLVEVAHIEAAGDIRQSIYVVRGEVDARVLRAHLSAGADRAAVTGWPVAGWVGCSAGEVARVSEGHPASWPERRAGSGESGERCGERCGGRAGQADADRSRRVSVARLASSVAGG